MANLTKAAESAPPTDPEELERIIKRAQKGDQSTLPALWKMLQDPRLVDRYGGDLALQVQQSLIRPAAGDNLLFREALTRKLELLRAELAGKDPTPIERLLVEGVGVCWLQVQIADISDAQAKDRSPTWAEYYQRRMNHAHRRYLSALKALALVRKLAVPTLKVAIPPKPVNGAGPEPDWQRDQVGANGDHRNGTVAAAGH